MTPARMFHTSEGVRDWYKSGNIIANTHATDGSDVRKVMEKATTDGKPVEIFTGGHGDITGSSFLERPEYVEKEFYEEDVATAKDLTEKLGGESIRDRSSRKSSCNRECPEKSKLNSSLRVVFFYSISLARY